MQTDGLIQLERELRTLSHTEDGIRVVQRFSAALHGTKERLAVFNASNALVRPPIDPAETATLGFNTEEDRFSLLQGDIVQATRRTSSASGSREVRSTLF